MNSDTPAANTTRRGLAVMDLDNTLLCGDSDFLWGQYMVRHGLVDGDRYREANERFHAQYMAGTLDIQEFCRFAFAPLAQHPRAALDALRARFVREEILPIVACGSAALIREHREAGDYVLITTATNRFVTEPIAELLGVDELIATDLEQRDGAFTGNVAGQPNFREGKVTRLHAWLAAQPQAFGTVSAYSDSANDLPLLEFADRPHAVHPDARLRAAAEARGWPILDLCGAGCGSTPG